MPKSKSYPPEIRNKMKAEYIAGSTRDALSVKYHIPEATICGWMNKENWSKARKQHQSKFDTKIIESTVNAQVKRATSELEFADFGLSISAKALKRIDKKLESGQHLDATELAILSRVITDGVKSISEMLKTKGLYTKKTSEQVNHSGLVQVTPIFGDMKLNVNQE